MSDQGVCPFIFCKGKSPGYQGKYEVGVSRAGMSTCVTTMPELNIDLCTVWDFLTSLFISLGIYVRDISLDRKADNVFWNGIKSTVLAKKKAGRRAA